MAPNGTDEFVSVAARPQASSKEKNFTAALRNSTNNVDQRALFASAGTGDKRKVRFSLLPEAGEDDAPTSSAKESKVEGADTAAGDTETGSVAVIKEWAKAYCENVIGCTMKNPWDGDSDDETDLESESEGLEGEEVDGEDESESEGLEGEEVEGGDESESHRLPDEDIANKSYTHAGSKRKADSISHAIELVERPKKRGC